MKVWLDDIREAPAGYRHCRSVGSCIRTIKEAAAQGKELEELNLDHDLGDYARDGGDGINLLNYIEEQVVLSPLNRRVFKNCEFRIHSMNPVGAARMRTVIHRIYDVVRGRGYFGNT